MLDDGMIGRIIQCHIDCGEPDNFVVGRLVYIGEKWFLMQDISPSGRWNGLALYPLSDIVSVDEDTDYIRRTEKLLNYRQEAMSGIPLLADDPLLSLLNYSKENEMIVGIEIHESGYRDLYGFVCGVDDAVLCVRQVDEFGRDDGKSYISLDAITRCFVDDEEAKILKVLSQS